MTRGNIDSNSKNELRKNIPNLFIAGAPKGGTTSIYHYLKNHKDIYASKVKEPWYFVSEFLPQPLDPQKMLLKVYKDEEEYLNLYSGRTDEKYILDGSVVTIYFKKAMEKIRRESPDTKLIISIRNPVDRLFSHYLMLWNYDSINIPFKKVVKNPIGISGMDMFELGMYYKYIKAAYEIFGREQVFLINYDDIAADTKAVMNRVCKFLGIDKIDSDVFNQRYNVHSSGIKNERLRNILHSSFMNKIKKIFPKKFAIRIRHLFNTKHLAGKVTMSKKLYKQLQAKYLEDIEKTEALTELDLSAWKK